ncbi:MAG: hypothetical protein V3S33_05675 [Gammaproteobacteria bacterium]
MESKTDQHGLHPTGTRAVAERAGSKKVCHARAGGHPFWHSRRACMVTSRRSLPVMIPRQDNPGIGV